MNGPQRARVTQVSPLKVKQPLADTPVSADRLDSFIPLESDVTDPNVFVVIVPFEGRVLVLDRVKAG